ncbi:MAG: riboflavin synthase [Rhodomicrobiaceae bacterium]
MFTGIITDTGTLVSRNAGQFEIACHYDKETILLGASISCDGCCLTVTNLAKAENGDTVFSVDVSPETLQMTTLDSWQVGQKINLERAMKMGEEFGGHIVSGHVDGVAEVISKKADGNSHRFVLKVPEDLKIYIAQKGSVTLNGVSLTVNEVNDDEFGVAIIPHTFSETTWHLCEEQTKMNIEIDVLARYALRANQVLSQKVLGKEKLEDNK